MGVCAITGGHCEYQKGLSNKMRGKRIPGGFGKCINPEGFCDLAEEIVAQNIEADRNEHQEMIDDKTHPAMELPESSSLREDDGGEEGEVGERDAAGTIWDRSDRMDSGHRNNDELPAFRTVDGEVVEPLNETEKSRLAELEKLIDRNFKAFIEVGMALREIRESRLYRETFATFEEYCREKFDITGQYANMKIASVTTIENLGTMVPKDEMTTMVVKNDSIPKNERQIRPLTKLHPSQQAAAWKIAVETAPGGRVTAKHVNGVVDEILGKESEKKAKETVKNVQTEDKVSDEFKYAYTELLHQIQIEKTAKWKRGTTRAQAKKYIAELLRIVTDERLMA